MIQNRIGWGFAVIAALLFLTIWGTYTSIVSNDEAALEAWGNVESTYQRRLDLIPNLVKVVEQYARHEKETLEAVTKMRASIGQFKISSEMLSNPEMLSKFQAAQGELGSALMRLMAISENYPELKANQNFLKLQDQLEGTENRINVARRDFNEKVRSFNVSIRTPHGKIVNSVFLNLEKRLQFSAQVGAENAPTVNFNQR